MGILILYEDTIPIFKLGIASLFFYFYQVEMYFRLNKLDSIYCIIQVYIVKNDSIDSQKIK